MNPFFCYFGGKWRAAPHYPAPNHEKIIEPFAGAVGYSVRHYPKNIVLWDKDPVIVGIWEYLIRTSPEEIRRLPSLIESIDDVKSCQEAKWLVGFWLNKGAASPCKKPSMWMRSGLRPNSFWGDAIKERIASNIPHISHWKIHHGDYKAIPNEKALWFIDPPYKLAGKDYKCGSSDIDFSHLGEWCRDREGSVIVCENEGAKWLPFQSFKTIKATPGSSRTKTSKEVIWTRDIK